MAHLRSGPLQPRKSIPPPTARHEESDEDVAEEMYLEAERARIEAAACGQPSGSVAVSDDEWHYVPCIGGDDPRDLGGRTALAHTGGARGASFDAFMRAVGGRKEQRSYALEAVKRKLRRSKVKRDARKAHKNNVWQRRSRSSRSSRASRGARSSTKFYMTRQRHKALAPSPAPPPDKKTAALPAKCTCPSGSKPSAPVVTPAGTPTVAEGAPTGTPCLGPRRSFDPIIVAICTVTPRIICFRGQSASTEAAFRAARTAPWECRLQRNTPTVGRLGGDGGEYQGTVVDGHTSTTGAQVKIAFRPDRLAPKGRFEVFEVAGVGTERGGAMFRIEGVLNLRSATSSGTVVLWTFAATGMAGGGGGDEIQGGAERNAAGARAEVMSAPPAFPPPRKGRWDRKEHETFLRGLLAHGCDWKSIAAAVGTRTIVQTRTHAQKYFLKLTRAAGLSPISTSGNGTGGLPRAVRVLVKGAAELACRGEGLAAASTKHSTRPNLRQQRDTTAVPRRRSKAARRRFPPKRKRVASAAFAGRVGKKARHTPLRRRTEGCDNCGRVESFVFRHTQPQIICCNSCYCYHWKKQTYPDMATLGRGPFAKINKHSKRPQLPPLEKSIVTVGGKTRTMYYERNVSYLALH